MNPSSLVLMAEQCREGRIKNIKSRFKVGERQDPEIQAETNKGNTVNILYDSSYYSLLTS